jgi:hypothetical protein
MADLTALGTIDWAHWGYATASDFDHRAGGDQLSSFLELGSGTVTQFGAFAMESSWTNGTPHATASKSSTGIYAPGVGTGFVLVIPGDSAPRVVRLFFSNYLSTARFTAHLSDASLPDFVDDTTDTGKGSYREYRVRYRGASPTASLRVTWQVTAAPDLTGNVSMESVTLGSQ